MPSYAANKGPVALGSCVNERQWEVGSEYSVPSESDSAIRTKSTESCERLRDLSVRLILSDTSLATSYGLEMALER